MSKPRNVRDRFPRWRSDAQELIGVRMPATALVDTGFLSYAEAVAGR